MPGDLFTDNPRATNANGATLSGAKWYFYDSGGLTPRNVFADSGLSTSLGSSVTADSGGLFADIYYNRLIPTRAILVPAGGDPTNAPDRIRDVDPVGSALAADLNSSSAGKGASLVKLSTGQTVEEALIGRLRDVTEWIANDGSTDDFDGWQAAVNAACAGGFGLYVPPGTSIIGDGSVTDDFNIIIPSTGNLLIVGADKSLCRIQKNYFSGTSAMFAPDSADAPNNVTIRGITFGCEPNVYSSSGTLSGKLISTGAGGGSFWTIEDCNIDHWNGWAITLMGHGHQVRRIHFTNPLDDTGVDGVHVAECDDAQNPHVIEDITGTMGDDCVAFIPYASGTGANSDILGGRVNRVTAESLNARVISVSGGNSAFTGTIANITGRQIYGKGGVYIDNRTPSATSVMRDIDIEATLDATGLANIARIRGPDAVAPTRMKRIRLKLISVEGATGPSGSGSAAIDMIGHIDRLRLEGDIDASGAENGLVWASPRTSDQPVVDMAIKGGSANIVDFTSTSQAITNGTFNLRLTNVANGQHALYLGYVTGSWFRVFGSRASGATTAKGINELSNCADNTFERGDLSALDTPVTLAQLDSTWQNNLGYKTESQGSSTVANGTSSIAVTHGLGYTPTLSEIAVIFGQTLAAATHFWITSLTSTQFTVNTSTNVSADRAFSWSVRRKKS